MSTLLDLLALRTWPGPGGFVGNFGSGTGMTAAHTVLTGLRGSLDVSGFGNKSLL